MNLIPPPESDNLYEWKAWATELYRFLQYMALHQMKFVGRADAPEDASAGVMYYDTDTNKLYCHNGTDWQALY